jgi:hypothetical protein
MGETRRESIEHRLRVATSDGIEKADYPFAND